MSLVDQLFEQILHARQRVYAAGKPTPLQKLQLEDIPGEIHIKREDLGPINAYKWRGAYNNMASRSQEELQNGVVCASAGNHAQGVARAARKLGTSARIYMPRSTPLMKQRAVKEHGKDSVEVILHGDAYDDAYQAALSDCQRTNSLFIHPYDDLLTMGGQGTMADEIVMSGKGPFTHAYIQIGGGGMAASVACWLKRHYPDIQIIGVEGEQQASMKAAFEQGQPTTLDYVDVFCDGTAVRRAGDNTYQLCRELIDRIVTVSNTEVAGAIRILWNQLRAIPEPAGAMGLAALVQQHQNHQPEDRILLICCGANMDFSQLASIASRSGYSQKESVSWRVGIPSNHGELHHFLAALPEGVNVAQVLYGKTDQDIRYPVVTLEADHAKLETMRQWLQERDYPVHDVTGHGDVLYRVIHYRAELFKNPLFVNLEFPERPGAFNSFIDRIADLGRVCYFNYAYSGERVGRALVGLEFETLEQRRQLEDRLYNEIVGNQLRAASPLPEDAVSRILS